MESLKTNQRFGGNPQGFLKNNCNDYVNSLLNSYYTYEGKTVETKFVITTINYDFVIYSGDFINDSYILNLKTNEIIKYSNNFISQLCNKLQNETITKIIKYLEFTNVNDIDVNKIYKTINNELKLNNNWILKNDSLYKIVYTQPNTKHLDPLLFKHQLLPYMAHTTEFPQTQNFSKCLKILTETTNKYTEGTEFRGGELNDLNFNDIPQDTLKLYNYCGQSVKEWIDNTNKPINVTYFSKNKYDILNCKQMDVIEITYSKNKPNNNAQGIFEQDNNSDEEDNNSDEQNNNSDQEDNNSDEEDNNHRFGRFDEEDEKSEPKKTIKFYTVEYRDRLEIKPITNYTGHVKKFLDNSDTVIKEIVTDGGIKIYNGCQYIFKNLLSDKITQTQYNELDKFLLSKLLDHKPDGYVNTNNKLQIYKDVLEHYSTEIKKIITKNDIYLNYFIEYIFIDYNEFNFGKLIDYKKLPTVNSWLSSTN